MQAHPGPVVVRRWPRRVLLLASGLVVLLVALLAIAWSTVGPVTDLQARVDARLAPQHPTPLASIAPVFQHAVVATEDEHFYSHSGVDVLGLLRAIPYDISHGTTAQGGSTITEQLAKILYLNGNDRAPLSKAKDIALALRIEGRYSKHQILDAYLNSVYLGDNTLGVQQASRHYFGVDASQLSLGQATLLAGMIQAPSALDPLGHALAARERQVDVLRSMVRNHFASEQRARAVLTHPLPLAHGRSLPALTAVPALGPGPTFDVRELVLGLVLMLGATVLILALGRDRVPVRLVMTLVFLLGLWSTIRSLRVA